MANGWLVLNLTPFLVAVYAYGLIVAFGNLIQP